MWRVGVDSGGTFTDICLVDEASGAVRVWLNGKLVHEDAALHPSRFDQENFAGALKAGDNFVLLKIAHSTGRPGFSLRSALMSESCAMSSASPSVPTASDAKRATFVAYSAHSCSGVMRDTDVEP